MGSVQIDSTVILPEKSISILETTPSQLRGFSCGTEELDAYLKRFARGNDRKRVSRTFVLLHREHAVGYYTLSSALLHFAEIPEELRKGLPRYPCPTVRLCRLAVDTSFQGRGLGERLLMESIERTLSAAQDVGVFALLVDAKNAKAKHFYEHYGFISCLVDKMSLFLPLDSISEAQVRSKTLAGTCNLRHF